MFVKNKISYLLLTILPLLFSCVSTKDATYFNITQDSASHVVNQNFETIIQKNDLLSITVSSLSAEASSIYNAPNYPNNASGAPSGYLVDNDGFIQFPVLGPIKAAGLTKTQLRNNITQSLKEKKLLLDPIVNIRNLNFKVTVLGEVGRPTVVNVPTEKINILEAIGSAGDLTLYAKRDNVLLIREEGGRRTYKLLNLNSNEIFTSPYYYLKPDDIIYVEPSKAKIASTSRANQWLPAIFSGLLSVVAIVLTRT